MPNVAVIIKVLTFYHDDVRRGILANYTRSNLSNLQLCCVDKTHYVEDILRWFRICCYCFNTLMVCVYDLTMPKLAGNHTIIIKFKI